MMNLGKSYTHCKPGLKKNTNWTTTGKARHSIKLKPTCETLLAKALWRDRHWVRGPNRLCAIKEQSIGMQFNALYVGYIIPNLPLRKIGQGQPIVIIWTNLVVLEHPMLHTKTTEAYLSYKLTNEPSAQVSRTKNQRVQNKQTNVQEAHTPAVASPFEMFTMLKSNWSLWWILENLTPTASQG